MIVVFPTHSFNTEPGGNPQIAPYYNQAGLYKFPVAEKVRVTNPNIHPLFAWLTDASQNGMMNSTISRPCFKYLIGKSGQFVGVYGQRVRPMSSILRNAIESSN